MRATVSAAPPGGNGTTSLIVRFGQAPALAPLALMSTDAAKTDSARKRRDRTKRTARILSDVRQVARTSLSPERRWRTRYRQQRIDAIQSNSRQWNRVANARRSIDDCFCPIPDREKKDPRGAAANPRATPGDDVAERQQTRVFEVAEKQPDWTDSSRDRARLCVRKRHQSVAERTDS
jgi:hypothetical protein